MGMFAKKVIAQAQAWLGKKESDGSHKEIIDVYNKHKPLARNYKVKYTDSWCATFVSAVAIKLGYTSIIPTECSCEKMIALFKKIGCWIEDENRKPNVGDIIFYDWQDSRKGDNKGWADHVGIVEKVSGSMITVIEGNYSNAVKQRVLAVNSKTIRGYGVPKYDAESVAKPSATNTTKKDVLEVDGEWGQDTTRLSQKALGTKVDGIISNQLSACKDVLPGAFESSWEFKEEGFENGSSFIRALQKLVGAEVDGHCGKDTVTKLQEFLASKGLYLGAIDGILGVLTVKGWQTYVNTLLKN